MRIIKTHCCRMQSGHFLLVVLACVLPVAVFAQADANKKPVALDADKTVQVSQAAVGNLLQDFELTDSHGNPVSLNQYQARLMLSNRSGDRCMY